MKRSRFHIIYDILRAVQDRNGKIRRTHILYKSNLSNAMLDEYLGELMQKQLLVEQGHAGKKTYALTDRGFEYLHKYKFFKEFAETFGLGE
jgi:predicted transcriptional regulator